MKKELQTWGFWRAALAELIGTTMLVFCGVSAAIGNGNSSYPDQEVKVALTFGLAIVILAQSLGHISGAHLNPAVTLAMLVSCQISMCRALWYIVAQVTGAVIASDFVLGVRPLMVDSLGLNKLKGVSPGQGFGIEFLLTLQLVLCVLATMDKRQDKIVCGLSVVLAHLVGISYTGCGINPARSFGPALVSVEFEHHWVFWAGPLCGGGVAALLYDFVLFPRGSDFIGRFKLKGVSLGQGFGIEFLLTFQLVLCVLAMVDKRWEKTVGSAPFACGLSVVLAHLAGVFWAGPLCGGIVAALLYDFVLFPNGSDIIGQLKALCHGTEALDTETEPLLEDGTPAAQSEES